MESHVKKDPFFFFQFFQVFPEFRRRVGQVFITPGETGFGGVVEQLVWPDNFFSGYFEHRSGSQVITGKDYNISGGFVKPAVGLNFNILVPISPPDTPFAYRLEKWAVIDYDGGVFI